MKVCWVCSLLLSGGIAFAQNQVNVDYSTGTATVNIPVYTVYRGAVKIPVSLLYIGSGVQVKQTEGTAGMSWNLSAGGSIHRILRGLPDDVQYDNASNTRTGWLYNNNESTITSFVPQNDNSSATCTDEVNDDNTVNGNFSFSSDTEPDLFNVSAPGLNCTLVFDGSHQIRTIPYQDLQVSYTSSSGKINSFTIINDQGIKYVFDVNEGITRTTMTSAGSVSYFAHDYQAFQNGISYTNSWYLSSISDPNGNTVFLNYVNGSNKMDNHPVNVWIGSGSNSKTQLYLYTISTTVNTKLVSKIYTSNNGGDVDAINFNYSVDLLFLNSISAHNGRIWYCHYITVHPSSGAGVNRKFLDTFGENNTCDIVPKYQFTYNGVSLGGGTTTLPDSSSKSIDFWGYYNGANNTDLIPQIYVYPYNASYPNIKRYRLQTVPGYPGTYYTLSGADRTVNDSYVTAGALTKITYPLGGSTTITYASNDYYDVAAGTTFKGAGLRVSAITESDGIGNSSDVTTNYSYLNLSTGQSSGHPISLPQYAFTHPISLSGTAQNDWNVSTIRCDQSFSGEDQTILYDNVTVSRTGAGKTVYEYSNPGTYWDNTASPDWTPTLTDFARVDCQVPYGYMQNSSYSYPFPPNTNFDFERSLLSHVTSYDESGLKVLEQQYQYQRTNSPIVIKGLEFDYLDAGTSYATYPIYCQTSELTSQVINTKYDVNDPTKQQVTTANSYYESSYHKNLTRLEVTNSDGSVKRSVFKYVEDYDLSAANDSYTQGLQGLNSLHINVPVEVYHQTIQGGVTKTTGADLSLFKTFSSGLSSPAYFYLPSEQLKFFAADGVTDFQPSFVSGGYFNHDSRYFNKESELSYDKQGMLLTAQDHNGLYHTVLTDHQYQLPVMSASNTSYEGIIYDPFEGDLAEYNPTISPSAYLVNDARSGSYSLYFPSGSYLQKGVTKASKSQSYLLSCWIKAYSSGTITITLTGGQQLNYYLSYDGTGVWKYYQLKIPMNGYTDNFNFSFTTNGALYLDDLLFYPGESQVHTIVYDPLFFEKIAETDQNGRSMYYTYDHSGRLRYVLDQDHNIISRNTYVNYGSLTTGIATPYFTYSPTTVNQGSAVTFSNSNTNSCLTGVTYTWNFGDGNSTTVNNTSSQNHTYTSSGTYTVSLTASHPIYGTNTYSQSVVVNPPALTVSICQSGVTYWDRCNFVALNTTTCGSNPDDDTHSYYTVTNISGAGGATITYKWQQSTNNGSTWTNIGTNSSQYVKFMNGGAVSCWIRCKITTSTGGVAYSDYEIFQSVGC